MSIISKLREKISQLKPERTSLPEIDDVQTIYEEADGEYEEPIIIHQDIVRASEIRMPEEYYPIDFPWHGYSKSDFKKLNDKLQKAIPELKSCIDQSSLERFKKKNKEVYNAFFARPIMVLEKDEKGEYCILGDGRHRIIIAKEQQGVLPVWIVRYLPIKDLTLNQFRQRNCYDNWRFYGFDNQTINTLSEDQKGILKRLNADFAKAVSSLMEYDKIDFTAPQEDEERIVIPVEGTYNSRFFIRLFLLRNHVIQNIVVSEFDMIQYQIPVKASNEELILLVFGTHALDDTIIPFDPDTVIGCSLCNDTKKEVEAHCPTISSALKMKRFEKSAREQHIVLAANKDYLEICEQLKALKTWIDTNLIIADNEYKTFEYGKIKWINEYKLYSLIKFWKKDAIFQYNPDWLSGQSIDVYIPSIKIGIEYQGKQHYESVDYFGGEKKLNGIKLKDQEKLEKCEINGVDIYQWPYTEKISFSTVALFFSKKKGDTERKLKQFTPCPVTDVLMKAKSFSKIKTEKKRKQREEKKPNQIIREYDKDGTLLGEYETIKQASIASGIGMASIQKCLSGQRKTANNHLWSKEKYGSKPNSPKLIDAIKLSSTGQPKPVNQIDPMTGEIVGTYDSIHSAAKGVGINSKGISEVLSGRQKTAGGFYWQKADN